MGVPGTAHAGRARALIGFIGPKVYERLAGEPFPPGIQVAENLYGHGLVDAVLTTGQVREVLAFARVDGLVPSCSARTGTLPRLTLPPSGWPGGECGLRGSLRCRLSR